MNEVTRRGLLGGGSATAAILCVSTPALAATASSATISGLRVDGLIDPLGLDNRKPRLSWRLERAADGAKQAAYRVSVASTPSLLAAGRPDLWDSGRIDSDRTFDVAYEGQPLQSRQECHWRVESWVDGASRATVSETAKWEMGLLQAGDWRAEWLEAEDSVTAADRRAGLNWVWGATPQDKQPRQFRWVVQLEDEPQGATLLIAAREELRGLWINGSPQTYQPFKKGPIDFWRMVTVPLSLRKGRNVIGIEAAWLPDKFPPNGGGAVAALLRVVGADGRTDRMTSGADWRTAVGSKAGWAFPAFDDKGWEKARPAQNVPRGEPWPAGPATLLRRRFDVDGRIRRARLYWTALGSIEASLNGKPVSDALLAPESTDFRKRVRYRVDDVTTHLTQGANVLGAHVGDGWYASTWLLGSRFSWGPAPRRALLQLEIEYADGRRTTIGSDREWLARESATLFSEIYDGETHDARKETVGWDSVPTVGDGWRAASAGQRPPAMLVAHATPPIRVTERRKATSIREVAPGVQVVDFGQNFSGWARVRGRAPAGTRLSMRFAEILRTDGRVDQSNLRSAEAHDTYVFRGDPGGEEWAPSFTYHGFRYVEVTGWPGTLPSDLLTGEVIHTDLESTGEFRSSDPLISGIWRNTRWGQRSNFVGIPTDCPQRDERLGWMGDAQVFWDAASFNMDVAAFTRRFMDDVRDAQDERGVFAEFAPRAWLDTPMKGAPGWADAGILLPWTTWWRYGDTAIIDQNWVAMTRWADFVMSANSDFVWRKQRGSDYADWLALDAKEPGDPTTPKDLVATAYWAHVTGKLAEMAKVTGRGADAERYLSREAKIREAFRRVFVNPDGTVGNGSQTGYILALRFGLVPAALRTTAADLLVSDIRRRGTVLSTGFLGTPHALDVLSDAGHVGLVYELLARTTYPSWGYMIAKGATTMWERWNSDVGDVAMNSFNHYALGAVVGFFYRRIAGIDAAEPGFRRIAIRPLAGGRLTGAAAEYDSMVGRISSAWSRSGDALTLDVTVPTNASARVDVPGIAGSARAVLGGASRRAANTPGSNSFEVNAGRHRFTSILS